MKRYFSNYLQYRLTGLLGLSILSCLLAASSLRARPAPIDWNALTPDMASPGYLLVRYDPALAAPPEEGMARRVQTHQLLGAVVTHEYRTIPWQVVRIPENIGLATAAATYARDPAVLDVEPNYILHTMATIPNDPQFGSLWGMTRIQAPLAWDVTTGNSDIIVGVIDTGIRYTHEDIAANMWVNPNPTFGDVHGARWTNGDGTPTSGNPMDGNGHGTHVAGTIGAVGNNSLGVAGVTWRVRLMALKFLSDAGGGSTADAISAIEYAIEHGAHLTNNSWGGGGYSQALRDVIAAAGEANQLFVAAAGNDAFNTDARPSYPATYMLDNIISVASIAPGGGLSGFSNYGRNTVHIGAPGSAILSAWADSDSSYSSIQGTSMASPHVAGAVALLLGLEPDLPYGQVRAAILDSATPNEALNGRTITGGELNVAAAVDVFAGSLQLDREAYRSDAVVRVIVGDTTVQPPASTVTVDWRTTDAMSVVRAQGTLQLSRVESSFRFSGDLLLETGVNAVHGDWLHVQYGLDTYGQPNVVSARIDDLPPEILDLRIETVTDELLEIRWMTDEPAIGGGHIGTELPLSQPFISSDTFVYEHRAVIENLEPMTLYRIAVWAEDLAGNRRLIPVDPLDDEQYSDDIDDYISVVTSARELVYSRDFERGSGGWKAESLFGPDCWEYGTPNFGPSPATPCWGTRINGRYPNSVNAVLTTPSFKVSEYPILRFMQWRDMQRTSDYYPWMSGKPEDCGYVEVLLDGVWHNVTRYADVANGQSSISGRSAGWEPVRVRLPEMFANRTIRVRFRFASDEYTFEGANPAGWYLDNFSVSHIPSHGLTVVGVDVDDAPPGGDGDGFAEPGETVYLRFSMFNFSDRNLSGVSGDLVALGAGSPAQDVKLLDGSPADMDYGAIPSGGTVISNPIGLRIGVGIDPDTVLTFLQTLTDSEGNVYETRFNLPVGPRVSMAGVARDIADGEPIEGVLIEATYAWDTLHAVSGVDGRFSLNGAITNRNYVVNAWKPDEYSRVRDIVRAPASNLEIWLGGAFMILDPTAVSFDLTQGQSSEALLVVSNGAHASLDLDYTLDVEYAQAADGWLQVEPVSGLLEPGEAETLTLSVDTAMLMDGAYLAFLRFRSNDASDDDILLPVDLLVRQRPLLAFGDFLVADDDNDDGRLSAGETANLWVLLRNTNAFSRAFGLTGTLEAVDPGQAIVTPGSNTLAWAAIPAGGSAWSEYPVEVTFDAGLIEGEVVPFALDVVDMEGVTHNLAFAITNYNYYSVTGTVNSVQWPDFDDPQPVEGARVTAEWPDGTPAHEALSNSNGFYRLVGVRGGMYWMKALPPPGMGLTPSVGESVTVNADMERNFDLLDNGPLLRLDYPVDIVGASDGVIDPGETFFVLNRVINEGGGTASEVTGVLATAPMDVPDVMTVVNGVADAPINVPPGVSAMLLPMFSVDVSPTAPRGSWQRFALTVTDTPTGENPPRVWSFDYLLQIDPRFILSGRVDYADGNSIEKLKKTRIQMVAGDIVRTAVPAADGSFRFGRFPGGTTPTIKVLTTAVGYRLPEPVALPPMDEDQFVNIMIDPWPVDLSQPDGLDFTFSEGQSVTGLLSVVNNTTTTRTLRATVRYGRELYEVRAPDAVAMQADFVPQQEAFDWTRLDPEVYRIGEVVVRFEDGVLREEQRAILLAYGLEQVFAFNSFPAVLARFGADTDKPASLAAALADDPRVRYVEPDVIAEPLSTQPNDPMFDQLWGLHNERQTGGTLGVDIDALRAWNRSTGSHDVIVAVCDTGIAIDHEDLEANIWWNLTPGSTQYAGENGIVGDIHGWNFFDWSPDVYDYQSHGTHVAGTIGATGDNGIGVVGVNWNVSLMALRLTDANGRFTTLSRIARAIEYAVDNGARISNHSWGGPTGSGAMFEAIRYARDNNHLVVVAAGNSARNVDNTKTYPAYYSTVLDNVITVAATDHDGELGWFSNFGAESVQLAAPGVDILSTVPTFRPFAAGDEGRSPLQSGSYGLASGTSMAAPHVSGAAALLWSLAPDAHYTVIKESILRSARHDPRLEGWVKTAGHLDIWGAVRALGVEWLRLEPEEFVLNPGEATELSVYVNQPPSMRAGFHTADIRVSDDEGHQFTPVTATVEPAVLLSIEQVRIDNLGPYVDDLLPSPGDLVDLWVTLSNRGSALAGPLTGVLTGGGNSTVIADTTEWNVVYGEGKAEASSALRVRLDPAAGDEVLFDLEIVDEIGIPVATLPLVVPVLQGHKLEGRVLTPAGAPVTDARVECWGAMGADTRTRSDGGFVLRGLSDGDYLLRAVPKTHERSEIVAFSLPTDGPTLPNLTVRAPAVALSSDLVHESLVWGLDSQRTVSIANASGPDAGPFEYTVYLAPRRRVALISDGRTLEPLVAPLRNMGFDVTRFTNNFKRVQRFWPSSNRYEIEQQVTYSWDQAILADYDAVILDLTGPDGHGRLISDGEVGALTHYVERGGKAIFTGANPLSLPDNDGLSTLAGITGYDREDPDVAQAEAERSETGPFISLETGDRLAIRTQRHDSAPVDNQARVLFTAGDANKLLRRAHGDEGVVYLWTGNPADADWGAQGLWNDVLRNILWRELIEDAEPDVSWLRVEPVDGLLGAGQAVDLQLTLNARYPLLPGLHQASLTIVGNYPGADVKAVRVDLDVQAPALRAMTSGAVTDWRGQPLRGDGSDSSSMFQVLWAGPDGQIDPPGPDGAPTGDDRLLSVLLTGLPHGRFGVGVEAFPDKGRFDELFRHAIPADAASSKVYVRAWDGVSPTASLAYGDSALRAITHVYGETVDFGSWVVDRITRYGRDSSGDSIPDGWLIENRPDIDPRAPVAALTSAGTYAGQTAVPPLANNPSQPRRVVVSSRFMFVLDSANNRIVSIKRATGAISWHGGAGSGNGQFAQPHGLALDPRPNQNRLIVADTGNNRIQTFTFNPDSGALTFERAFGVKGSGTGQLRNPRGVAMLHPGGDIFVADTDNHRIQIFGANGTHQRTIVGAGDYLMNVPRGIAVDSFGIWVADTGNQRVLNFSHIGTPIRRFGTAGSGNSQFATPTDVQVWHHTRPPEVGGGTVRRLCVVDSHNHRVQLFLPDGTHLLNVGSPGDTNGKLTQPYGVFPLRDDNRLFVADTLNKRVQWFTVLLDADGDGMDDFWEDVNGLDSTRNDALEDPDNDGLLNIGEFRARSNPLAADSNNNGVGDLWHLYNGLDPSDPNVVALPSTLSSLVSDRGIVGAGTWVTLTATFDLILPDIAEARLSLTGATEATSVRMRRIDERTFAYDYRTKVGEAGLVNAAVFCGWADPANYDSPDLFEIVPDPGVLPTIAGRVTHVDTGDGIEGVTVVFGGLGNVLTDEQGDYAREVPYGWSGTVTPALTGGPFAPSEQSYVSVVTDLLNEDYVWTPDTLLFTHLYFQTDAGLTARWRIDQGGAFLNAQLLGNVFPWKLMAAGDVDGDGIADLLWQTPPPERMTGGWIMNADGSASDARYWWSTGPWEMRAAADYDADGRANIFWQTDDGHAAVWTVDTDGAFVDSTYLGLHSEWRLAAAGDLNADGRADIFWQNAVGQVRVQYAAGDGTKLFVADTGNWRLVAAADIDGDGVVDLLWQTPSGLVAGWFMNDDGTFRDARFWWDTGVWRLKAAGP